MVLGSASSILVCIDDVEYLSGRAPVTGTVQRAHRFYVYEATEPEPF